VNIGSVARTGVVALVSGVAGYSLQLPDQAPPGATAQGVETARAGSRSNSPPTSPLIALSSDGNVTLRVDQQPLEWVLEQIALQGGNVKATAMAAAIRPASAEPSCPKQTGAARIEPAKLLQEIERGSEEQRVHGLLEARSAGVFVPDGTLKTLFETDASERVRLHAFEAYLERQTGDNAALRRTLEAAALIPSAVIQREARTRLNELTDMERMDALFNQQAGS